VVSAVRVVLGSRQDPSTARAGALKTERRKKPARFGRDDRCCCTGWNQRLMVYHVYILASASGVLYTGVSGHLERRVGEHQRGDVDGFTRRYGVHRLVYFQAFGDIRKAIAWEKQLKGWRREKKIALIRKENPGFGDLSERLTR
jgi:putative endonuclease